MAGTDLPDVRSEADVPAEAPSYDVVVVGFGIAGGCAALEAARAGASVLLLERAAVHGGTSSLSGGHFYLGGGTAVQRATGHEDSVEEMAKYINADSLAFISIDGLYRALGDERDGANPQRCDACFTGAYPTALTDCDEEGRQRPLSLVASR